MATTTVHPALFPNTPPSTPLRLRTKEKLFVRIDRPIGFVVGDREVDATALLAYKRWFAQDAFDKINTLIKETEFPIGEFSDTDELGIDGIFFRVEWGANGNSLYRGYDKAGEYYVDYYGIDHGDALEDGACVSDGNNDDVFSYMSMSFDELCDLFEIKSGHGLPLWYHDLGKAWIVEHLHALDDRAIERDLGPPKTAF